MVLVLFAFGDSVELVLLLPSTPTPPIPKISIKAAMMLAGLLVLDVLFIPLDLSVPSLLPTVITSRLSPADTLGRLLSVVVILSLFGEVVDEAIIDFFSDECSPSSKEPVWELLVR